MQLVCVMVVTILGAPAHPVHPDDIPDLCSLPSAQPSLHRNEEALPYRVRVILIRELADAKRMYLLPKLRVGDGIVECGGGDLWLRTEGRGVDLGAGQGHRGTGRGVVVMGCYGEAGWAGWGGFMGGFGK